MYKSLFVLVLLFSVLFVPTANAEVCSFDFDMMSTKELDALLDDIRDEKRAATEFSNEIFNRLKPDFMSTVESLAPEAEEYAYPLLGLSRDRNRTCYVISGTVTAKFADNTEGKFKDATIVYWNDTEKNLFKQVAFYTRDEVYFVEVEILKHLERYMDKAVVQRLYEYAE